MSKLQQAVRHQHWVEELSGAVLRALSQQDSVYFQARRIYKGSALLAVYAPHLQSEDESVDKLNNRGIVDAVGLRLQHTNESLHATLCPRNPIARLIFEMLEQFRVESLVPDSHPGSKRNLQEHFFNWSQQFHHSGVTDGSLGILLFTVAQITRARIHSMAVPEEYEDMMEATRAGIVPLLGQHLVALKKEREDQERFAKPALALANLIAGMIDSESETVTKPKDEREEENKAGFRLLLNFDEGDAQAFQVAGSGESKTFSAADGAYRVFTRIYDREVTGQSLLREAQLKALREQLDKRVQESRINVARLAQQFQRLFMVAGSREWDFGREEGYIDGRRLAGIISSPSERRVFCQEEYRPKTNAQVSLLLDCSGSMKAHIEQVAVYIDVLCRVLDRAAIPVEVLGFSTGGWNGGRARKDWFAKGKPDSPGRLNETTHIVFKPAEKSWIRSRINLGALLKPELFREGVDGEAVDWACSRLKQSEAHRRVLLVISDGCPMDSATAQANDDFYLDNHLKQVLARQEAEGAVEVYGIGVELDLSPYYRKSLALDLSEGVNAADYHELIQMLAGVQLMKT